MLSIWILLQKLNLIRHLFGPDRLRKLMDFALHSNSRCNSQAGHPNSHLSTGARHLYKELSNLLINDVDLEKDNHDWVSLNEIVRYLSLARRRPWRMDTLDFCNMVLFNDQSLFQVCLAITPATSEETFPAFRHTVPHTSLPYRHRTAPDPYLRPRCSP